MPPQQSQPNMNPNQVAGNLGFITNMQQQLLEHKAKKQGKIAPQTPQNAPQQEQNPEPKEDKPKPDEGARIAELELSITKKLDDIRQELKGDAKSQVAELKKQIEEILNEPD